MRITAIAFPDNDDTPHRPLPQASVEFLQRLGVDPGNRQDMRDLAEDWRWVRAERLARVQREADHSADKRERRLRLFSALYGAIGTVIGGLMTWIYSHLGTHP